MRFSKILIANRGEIALRIMRTCRELGIATVAVYSDADRSMPHVLHADEAYPIGPPPSRESYLVMDRIIAAARACGAEAIHPGYGFLAENPEFARRVEEADIVFIGPSPESMRAMGDKIQARALVSTAGVPVLPGTPGPIGSEDEVRAFGVAHGFPVLLKAAAGGGGKGMRVIRREDEIPDYFRAARSESLSAFGDGRVYIEKFLDQPRHIEFQILADNFGNTVHLGERDCSIQRRHQKIIEETPSVVVNEELRNRMGDIAVQAARSCHYRNAGTVEFLVDDNRNYYFLEMNTRLQVEHPVTEMRTGVDLVALQIAVASGEHLPFSQDEIRFSGHAIECRICAEDPENSYIPSTGVITRLRPAQGIGIREDRGIDEGGEVSVYYDPLLAKLIAWAPTREQAIRRMLRALREYQITGVVTNIPLCVSVLQHPRFAAGVFDTQFLSREFEGGSLGKNGAMDRTVAALLCAILEDRRLNEVVASEDQSASRRMGGGWRARRRDGMGP